ncbi:hypothetical protein [Sulfuricaulis sp.]|jgi:hypothetical protein|uniref:hypothetical protein n=1 Tax=Sulfuricaulis sp. TaxID=2003553 RepID=UPI0035598CBC
MATDQKTLADAVKTAKEAVRELDEPLKTEAFKILLERLISGNQKISFRRTQKNTKKSAGAKAKAARGDGNRATLIPHKKSSLNLSVEELKTLKSYCERFELKGTELTAFILANFLREHTALKAINAEDVDYCYRQLVALKFSKLPRVNEVADWARAIQWLTAPSRKKQWLQRAGDGYVISNAGLLHFNELESSKGTS